MNCILHIGTEKTGTSSVQRFLSANREALAQRGILYPTSPGLQVHEKLAAYAAADEKRDDLRIANNIGDLSDLIEFRARFESELDAELDRRQNARRVNTVIFSSEHCHSRLETLDEIVTLKQLLDARFDKITILVYFRRQDRMAVSLYSTQVKYGGVRQSVFPSINGEAIPYYFDFYRIASNWRNAYSHSSIRPRVYHRSELVANDIIDDLCHACGIDTEGLKRPPRSNESLTEPAQVFLRMFNQHCPGFCDGSVNELRQNVVPVLEKYYTGRGRKPAVGAAREFMSRFRDTNRRLGEEYFGGQDPFDAEFDEYPETESEYQITPEECVDIAAQLWKEKASQVLALRKTLHKLQDPE